MFNEETEPYLLRTAPANAVRGMGSCSFKDPQSHCRHIINSLAIHGARSGWSHIACAPKRVAVGHAGAKSKSQKSRSGWTAHGRPRPHEQHRFRAGRPVAEHLWLASCFSVNIPVSICLECVILWTLIWVLQRKGLPGGIVGDFGQSDQFLITGSVRQGCVLSPADAKLIFAQSHHVLAQLVASLMIHLEKVGLHFYAGANRLQLLQRMADQRSVGQKWLGCRLAAGGSQSQHIDLEYHLQQASTFCGAIRWNLIGPKGFHFQTLQVFQCRGLIRRVFW